MTILYESLCPDSQDFIEQLGRQYSDIKDKVVLQFVPFGKAYVSMIFTAIDFKPGVTLNQDLICIC